MDLGSVELLAVDAIHGVLSVPATVTRPAPDDLPIVTTAVWVTSREQDLGLDLQRREPQRLVALKLAAVPTVPRGTIVVAPERSGGLATRWRVEGPDRSDPYETRVVVVPDPEP
jgi:hypothetical protein